MSTLPFILSELSPLDGFRCNFVSAPYLENRLEYNHDTSELCRTGLDDVSSTRMTTLAFILSCYFPLMVSEVILCPLHNLKTVWNILTILYSNVEQVMTMCRIQEWQPSLLNFLSYLPLMVSDAISCPLYNLNTLWNMILILNSYVEKVMAMCRVQK